MDSFSSLPLADALRPGLDALGLATPTPIQAQSLPALLAGRDLLALAPTGSGKTVAFALAALSRIELATQRAQALVLCPTRELADQVGKQMRRLAVGLPNLKLSLLYGGTALGPQIASLEQHDPHVVVGTPGRIQELMRKKHLHLGGVRTVVLDEADRMLDMGFLAAIEEILRKLPAQRQSILLSATLPEAIRQLAGGLLRDPLEVRIEGADSAPRIEERFYECAHAAKPQAVLGLLQQAAPEACVVFCNTRQDVDSVAGHLRQQGVDALALHGDMEQRDREEVLVRFGNRSLRVLVASDVAARGIDIDGLDLVVNYELPTDADAYRHRIGRTARAGREGRAFSLVSPREMPRALALEKLAGAALDWGRLGGAARPGTTLAAAMRCLRIDAGKTDKLRPGDILGALTGEAGLPADSVGRIDLFPTRAYVAVRRQQAAQALQRLQTGTIKGRKRRVRQL
ncbi:ATP-dependent RNA helicase DbpA [Pseudomarimonas salicorniae]|uniref:ATP-dependent RNA helicase DbpA n=1 Tax=Pseudomarimonas salicorniae TaxID=2933270 RepID=A0ABT0GJY7_9GAMM|nr:ATP-dependent RNA helicase DbpA [Lysobacter sp. CAU 1642]MCK7594864.1 ATP-dependent RNA helicase DbpA [Lysobacter sp. CAU 1642]